MSLSKYYPKSDAFKPEDLFKPAGDSQFKQTSSGKSRDKFQSQSFTTTAIATDNKRISKNSGQSLHSQEDSESNIPPTANQATAAANQRTPQNNNENASLIDPDKYIEIAQAKKQIEQALRQGQEEGEQKADQEFGDATRSLVNICQQLDTIRETIINNSKKELLDFTLAIAERILRISLAEQDKTIIHTLEEALHRAVRSDEFTIFIHPDDYRIVQEKTPDLIANISGLSNLVLKEDATVGRGGAKIESENCTIDATVASQFEVIREELQKQG